MVDELGQVGGAHNIANPITLGHDRIRAICDYVAPMFNGLNPEVIDSFKLKGMSEEALRLKLFPFSLKDRARAWLNTRPPDLLEDESTCEAWERFKELLRKYPHHGSRCIGVQIQSTDEKTVQAGEKSAEAAKTGSVVATSTRPSRDPFLWSRLWS
uniref:Retrotransposon gag domain-containing protein n=1 Tax=Cannabis sativa TaxID=3483 RepID=A0A803QQI7_CANSA